MIVPYFNNLGKNIIIINNLNNCSITFDRVCGNIFCFPKKYPLIILDNDINGRTKAIDIIGKYVSLLCNKLFDIIGATINITLIRNIFIISDAGMIENNIFLLRTLFSAIMLLIASGKPNPANVINNE